jgi:NO-binding membrane sensor protein with MHYT domain
MMSTTTLLLGLIPLDADANAVSAPFAHDRTLVAGSMLVAVVTAYAFLELAARARTHGKMAARLWNVAAGAAFGLCLFLTHLMGLIALDSPLVHGLSVGPTALSGAVAVVTGCAAFVLAGSKAVLWRIAVASIVVGAGAITMHYLGMRGLEIEAVLTYRAPLIAITTAGAFVGSVAALWLAHRLEAGWLRAVVAFPMGAVSAGLHYTDVAAMVVRARPTFQAHAAGAPEAWQAAAIVALALATLFAALIAAALDRQAARHRAATADDYVVTIPGAPQEDSGVVVVLPERRKRP